MATEKILTRVISQKTGDEYFIGTRGSEEVALIKLHSNLPNPVIWTEHAVKWQDLTAKTSGTVPLSETGECNFSIPIGNKYEVAFPKVGTLQPSSVIYTATSGSRNIEHIYSESQTTEEVVDITFYVKGSAATEILEGASVLLLVGGVAKYAGVILNGNVKITVPFGTEYTISLPELTGYRHDHSGESHTAGIPSREIFVRYFFADAGVLGVDMDGNRYTYTEIKNKLEDGTMAADDIVAIAFLDDELNAADRGDGTTGCEFMFKVNGSKRGNMTWCNQNLDFGTGQTKVELGSDAMPYIQNHSAGLAQMAGMHYTRQIIECGKKLNDSGVYSVVTTPAATNCAATVLTLNDGVDRVGYLPSYGQLARLSQNQEIVTLIFDTLGKSSLCPVVNSGIWWTSCQYNGTNAVHLNGGAFNSGNKDGNGQVLAVYDL